MAFLSQRLMREVGCEYRRQYGLRAVFVDLSGRPLAAAREELARVPGVQRRRSYALQESVNQGEPYAFEILPGIASWMIGLEDRRQVLGGLSSGAVALDGRGLEQAAQQLAGRGRPAPETRRLLARLPRWTPEQGRAAAQFLQDLFYRLSGWKPLLMNENRLRLLQQAQLAQAIEDRKKHGSPALYAFEKERALLAHIRAGDRSGARSILNEMLASIYMSSPQLVVLRARAIEMLSCLTRAAIEDNPLLEPLIERNHSWTEGLLKAKSFEDLSRLLMDALDAFIEGIYLHGMNRSNMRVRRALDYLGQHFTRRISLAEVAREAGVSPCRLAHLVKSLTGRTVLQIVHQLRIRQAQHLLDKTVKPCSEIAAEIGYHDQSYFIRHFKRITGSTPAHYRRSRGG